MNHVRGRAPLGSQHGIGLWEDRSAQGVVAATLLPDSSGLSGETSAQAWSELQQEGQEGLRRAEALEEDEGRVKILYRDQE